MRPMAALLAAALVPFLAGCADDPAARMPDLAGPAVPAAMTIANNATGCYEAVAVFLADFDALRAVLPANWTPADAQALLGTPEPTGRGGLWLNGYTCAHSDMAQGPYGASELGVLVIPPTFEGNASPPEADIHVYEVLQYTNSSAVRDALGAVGFAAANGTVRAYAFEGPVAEAAMQGSVEVSDDAGVVFRFDFAAPQSSQMTTSANFWQQNANGTAYFRYELTDRTAYQGSVTFACEARADTMAAQVMGTTPCGPGTALALLIPEQEWASTFTWMPGQFAAGPAR